MDRCMFCRAKLTDEEQHYYGYSCDKCEGYYAYTDDDTRPRPWNSLRRVWNTIRGWFGA